jgi:hypothetical protein
MLSDWAVRAGLGVWLAIALGALSGCIGAAGIPGGPLQGTGMTLGGSWGYAVAPARVTMQSSTDGHRASYTDGAADAINMPLFPSRLGGRLGATKWFDVGADVSYLDSGLELRGGLPEGARPFPLALSVGMRRGNWGLLNKGHGSSEQRVRLEAYPRLADLQRVRLNLISTLGVSTGKRFHPLSLPNRFAAPSCEYGCWPQFSPNSGDVFRDETRVEGSAGVELRQDNFFMSVVLMPYVVASASHLAPRCQDCSPDFQVQRFQSSFGAALFLTLGVSFRFAPDE